MALSYLRGFLSQRILKRVLAAKRFKADANALYLYSNFVEMVWPSTTDLRRETGARRGV